MIEGIVRREVPQGTCGERAHDCMCGEAADHLPFTPHACGTQGCRASWTGSVERSTFRPITYPTWPVAVPRASLVLVRAPDAQPRAATSALRRKGFPGDPLTLRA